MIRSFAAPTLCARDQPGAEPSSDESGDPQARLLSSEPQVEVLMSRLVIDSDAHVLETERTWDYLDASEQKYRPLLVPSAKEPGRSFWIIDGQVAGLKGPTLTEQLLRSKSSELGRDLVTPDAARGMDDVALRLRHMDELGIDVQVLHHTMRIRPVPMRPDNDVALSHSCNGGIATGSQE